MKLLRLKLNVPFRSLSKGFEIQFLDDWNWARSFRASEDYLRCFECQPYCLAGINGSGKSNVLEVLAAIFYHIECVYLDYRPEGFEREGYGLRLMAVESIEDLPSQGQLLLIIAKMRDALHIRIFDIFGSMIIDKEEAEFDEHQKLNHLKDILKPNFEKDVSSLTNQIRDEIILIAISCVGLRSRGFSAEEAVPDGFELEYLIPNDRIVPREPWPKKDDWPVFHIRITKQVGHRPEIHWLNTLSTGEVTETELTRAEVKAYLPTYILGYSSGHNETLSLPFFKMRFIHFDEYRDKLIKNVDYPDRPEGRLIYLDDQFSQVILLCHYLFPSETVTKIFKDKVSLEGFRCFRLIIRSFHLIEIDETPDPNRLTGQAPKPKKNVELTDKLTGIINKLTRCSTTQHKVPTPKYGDNAYDLYLDYWVDDAIREAFQFHFRNESGGTEERRKADSALNLFHAFQTLLTLNSYQVDAQTKLELYRSGSLYLNETIPTPASHERIARFKDSRLMKTGVSEEIYLKNLSDGEHQLLHTIGLCLVLRCFQWPNFTNAV